MAITRAPHHFASWIAIEPTPLVPPRTSTVSPGRSRALSFSIVHDVSADSVKHAASSHVMELGFLNTLDVGTEMKSAEVPSHDSPRIS